MWQPGVHNHKFALGGAQFRGGGEIEISQRFFACGIMLKGFGAVAGPGQREHEVEAGGFRGVIFAKGLPQVVEGLLGFPGFGRQFGQFAQ